MGLFDRLFGRKKEELTESVIEEAAIIEEESPLEEIVAEAKIQPEEKEGQEFNLEREEESEESASETHLETDDQLATSVEVQEETAVEIPLAEAEFVAKVESEDSVKDARLPEEKGDGETTSQPSAMEAYYAELQERIAQASQYHVSQITELEAEAKEEEAVEATSVLEESIQDKYDRSLKKTRSGFGARLNAFFANFRTVDEEFFEELEELLIMSDVGVQVASNLTEELRQEARLENARKPDVLRRVIIEKLVQLYEKDGKYDEHIQLQSGLTVMLFVGVNGVGKTTSIGKLAYKYKTEGKRVMLVAADTFRAGAVAQLEEWAHRVEVPIVVGPEKSDPASVVFDGMERAQAEGVDILMIDTAGRLQNKENLMAELEKIGRIIKRVDPQAPHETFLALDASTGQNALVQAKEFSKITPITGIVLTKIDGTARGGVVLAIREELDIPVKLIGFGEKIDDIGEFQSENFMRGLLDGLI